MEQMCDICGKKIPENFKEAVIPPSMMIELVKADYAPPDESLSRAAEQAKKEPENWLENWKTVTVPNRDKPWHLCNDCTMPAVQPITKMGFKVELILNMKGEISGIDLNLPMAVNTYGEAGVCTKCGTKTSEGENYQFSYGNEIGRKSTTYATGSTRKTTVTTQYEINGKEQLYLCDNCVAGHHLKIQKIDSRNRAIMGAIAFVFLTIIGIALWAPDAMNGRSDSLIALVISPFIGLTILYIGIRGIQKANLNQENIAAFAPTFFKKEPRTKLALLGDKVAIELRKDDLTKQGFKMFFTRKPSEIKWGKRQSKPDTEQ